MFGGARNGRFYRVSPPGRATQFVDQIEHHARTLPGKPVMFVQDTLLESADSFAFGSVGTLQMVANKRNTNTVTADGKVQERAEHGSHGPLELHSALDFVGDTACVSDNDTPPGDNMVSNSKSALDRIGASIVQIMP